MNDKNGDQINSRIDGSEISHDILRGSLNALTQHIAILNKNGKILFVNDSWRSYAMKNDLKMQNWGIESNYLEICDDAVGEFAVDAQEAAKGIRRVIEGEITEFSMEYPCHIGEEQNWFVMRVTGFIDDGDLRLMVTHENITPRKLTEEKNKLNADRLSTLLELSQSAEKISETDIIRNAINNAVRLTNSQIGYLHFVNPDQETIELKTWSDDTLKHCTAVYDNQYPIADAGIWADCVRTSKPVIHNDYQGLKNKKGYPEGHVHLIRHASIPIFDQNRVLIILGVGNKELPYDQFDINQLILIGNQLTKIILRKRTQEQLEDINERLKNQINEIERLQGQLREQAIRDPLTGLFNRRYLDVTLQREFARAYREGSPISAVILDIDDFKIVNDTFGHHAGDEVLKQLGSMLAADSRASDIACRYGGDEFLVLLPGAARPTAVNRAESWRRNFSQRSFKINGDTISLTVSVGVACYPINSSSPDGLLKAADKALYASKAGKNQVSVSPRAPTRPLHPFDDKAR